jgi:pyrophosphatase PpaX
MLTEYPGIPELVTDLVADGVQVGAATSKRAGPAQWALDLGHLTSLVPLLVAHDDVTEHKPNPAPLLLACEKLGRAASDAVYIGDAVVDIDAAHRASMASIAVSWGAGSRHDLLDAAPTFLVDTVDELRTILLP